MIGNPVATMDTKNAHIVIAGFEESDAYITLRARTREGIFEIKFDENQCHELIDKIQSIMRDNDDVKKGVLY